jgi:hypothetical protein
MALHPRLHEGHAAARSEDGHGESGETSARAEIRQIPGLRKLRDEGDRLQEKAAENL